MLDFRAVGSVLGALLFFLAIALMVTAAVDAVMGGGAWQAFAWTGAFSGAVGGAGWLFFKPGRELRIREGFAIVALAWFVLSLVGAIPFMLAGVLDNYTDAFFETISGFTTTGATIMGGEHTPEIEALPPGILFWRSLTQWLGGMGIIVLTLAILPLLGVGGMQLYKAEVSGPSADKLTPRVKETAKRLWYIYIGFTVLQILLLTPAIGVFEAVNHAFTTMATGGYSTQNASIAGFQSAYVEWVITLFMFLAGVSFALHFRLFRGEVKGTFLNRELRLYSAIILGATVLVLLSTLRATAPVMPIDDRAVSEAFDHYGAFLEGLRYSAFQVVSITTTTGYGTADYAVWPPLALGVIFLLFFVGGMAGSTGGGIKVIRHLLFFKITRREIQQLIHPQAILPIRIENRVIPEDIVRNVLVFMIAWLGLIVLGTLGMALSGLDLLSAFGGAISAIANVGPAFGSLGPVENYAHVPWIGKWLLALLMLAGRLELFTVLVLFAPAFWRK